MPDTSVPSVSPPVSPPVSPSVSPSMSPLGPARKRDRMIGLLLVATSFLACLVLSFWANEKSRPETSQPPGPPIVKGIAGYPNHVDPLATLNGARGLTKRSNLRGIVIDGARFDGTIDVSDASGRVRYAFQSGPGQGPQPRRDPGTLPKRITCGLQSISLRKEGLVAEPDQADFPCQAGGVEPLPEPQCSLHEIWKLAHRRRAPRDKPAHIEYYRSKVGPAWRFDNGSQSFTVYGDCKRELVGAETHGSVP
jgi:hypothetical protein